MEHVYHFPKKKSRPVLSVRGRKEKHGKDLRITGYEK
jgi:hypothetical protein